MPDASVAIEATNLPEGELQGHLAHHPKVRAAHELACLLHRDQTYGDKPYIVHVVGVANMVYRASEQSGQTQDREKLIDELCAALLHDSIEDRPDVINRKIIEQGFGRRVADIVEFCTDRFKEGQPLPQEELAQIHSGNIVDFFKKWEEKTLPESEEITPEKKDGTVGEAWLDRKKDYLTKLTYAATDEKWRGRSVELESAVTICCADKLMNMQRTNQRLKYAIAHGSKADPQVHQFWASFKSAQMERAHYDFLLANAFGKMRDDLGDVGKGRFSSLVEQFSEEVVKMRGMMTDPEETRREWNFQQKILQEREISASSADQGRYQDI